MEVLAYFIVSSLLAAWWIIAIAKLFELGLAGREQFFKLFLIMLGIAAIFFTLLVVPTFDCVWYLCGFFERMLFFAISIILLVVFPFIMITIGVRKAKEKKD